ncbi:MAG: Bax inhibitor-1/YccA family protein [Patescibacteria group bacterium]|mgnify:CR=1 FL=1
MNTQEHVYSVDYINRRQVFYNAVFFAFALAMAVSAAGVYLGLRYGLAFFALHPGSVMLLFALELILIFTSRMWSRTRPLNYLLFSIFALCTGLTLVPLLASFMIEFGTGIVLKALMATVSTFLATALIGWTARRSFAGLGSFLFVSLIGLIITGLIGLFIPWNNTVEMVVSGAAVVIFSGFVMYDIQRIREFPDDMYIDAALMLYLDIFNLFINMLRLLGALRRN